MKKVSMWIAAKKTWLLLNARSGLYAKYVVGLLVLNGIYHSMELMGPPSGEEAHWGYALVGLGYGLLSMCLGISMFHFTINSLRSRTSFIPESPVGTFFKYLLSTIAIFAMGMILGAICMSPMLAVLPGVLYSTDQTGSDVLLTIGFIALGAVVSMWPLVRFGPVLPALTVGDKMEYAKAWRMTKGHTGRLLLWLYLLYLPPVLVGAMWGGVLALSDPEAVFEPTVAYVMVSTLVNVAVGIFVTPFFGVVYEDLKNRYETMADVSSSPSQD